MTTEDSGPDPTVEATVVADGPVPAAEWAQTMIAAWTAYLTARIEPFVDYDSARRRGEHFVVATQALVTAEAELLEEYAVALDAVAADPTLDAAADPMRSVVDEMAAAARTVAELGAEAPDQVRTDWDATAPGELPASPWGEAYGAFNSDEFSARLDEACLDLQAAIDDAGHGLVDCAGSSIDPPQFGEVLQPGVHEFTEFAPGLTLEVDEPVEVFEAGDVVEVSTPDALVDFIAVDEVLDPSGLGDPDNDATVPLPDELGPWLAQVPVTVLAAGTVDTATGPAPYWDLQVDAARMAEMAPGEVFLQLATYEENESFGSFSFIGGPPAPDQHFIVADWRRGDQRILVYSIGEQGDPLLESMQTLLAGAS